MKQLVAIVEGDSDAAPVANIVNRILLTSYPGAPLVASERHAIRAGGLPGLSGRHTDKWLRAVRLAAQPSRNAAGVLAVFDGDDDFFDGLPFCAVYAARRLASAAADAGAGVAFPLAVVILCREYESLLLAVADQLLGYGGGELPPDPENAPRGAKEWLGRQLGGGYKEADDQLRLTQQVKDWSPAREKLRCFRRLESAVGELVAAALAGAFCCTPAAPPTRGRRVTILLDAVYALLLALAAPWALWRRWRTGRYRNDLRAKLFGSLTIGNGDRRPVAWFHGVSVGEVHLLVTLVAAFRARRPGWRAVVSSTTDSGLAEARARFGADAFAFPLDFSWACRSAVRHLRPRVVVLAESELWPNFLAVCKQERVPVVVANARLSPRSFARLRRLRPLASGLLVRPVAAFAAQDAGTAARLTSLGARRVAVTGSVKYDGAAAERDSPKMRALAEMLRLDGAARPTVLVAGSTHGPEERVVLAAFARLRARFPRLILLLVPRHPDRFGEVARLVAASGLPWARRSELTAPVASVPAVLLLDTVGELGAAWGLADVGFVGGSLDGRRGGQSMIEPAGLRRAVRVRAARLELPRRGPATRRGGRGGASARRGGVARGAGGAARGPGAAGGGGAGGARPGAGAAGGDRADARRDRRGAGLALRLDDEQALADAVGVGVHEERAAEGARGGLGGADDEGLAGGEGDLERQVPERLARLALAAGEGRVGGGEDEAARRAVLEARLALKGQRGRRAAAWR